MSHDEQARILTEAEAYVRAALAHDSSGHDWWHIARVRAMARRLAHEEGADTYICELAALLHDVADDKIAGDEETGLRTVRAWLIEHGAEVTAVEHVMQIIGTMSFGGGNRPPMETLEGRVVQDADRLDALGAVGIARAFAYGGAHGRALYDPDDPPHAYRSKTEYRASQSSTINHFHEKLLLLKDRMNTATGRRFAAERHTYMEAFLAQFAAEWEGER
jgi:uncharacterized protein